MSYLRDAARWAKFLSVVGFIFCGLFVLFAILFATALSGLVSTMGSSPVYGAMGGGAFAAVYIVIALLYFFPCLYLYNFANRMKIALLNNDQVQLNISFKNLRALYRFIGILMIIGLCIWVLGVLIVIISAGSRM
jgi:hypothetical protein